MQPKLINAEVELGYRRRTWRIQSIYGAVSVRCTFVMGYHRRRVHWYNNRSLTKERSARSKPKQQRSKKNPSTWIGSSRRIYKRFRSKVISASLSFPWRIQSDLRISCCLGSSLSSSFVMVLTCFQIHPWIFLVGLLCFLSDTSWCSSTLLDLTTSWRRTIGRKLRGL